MHSSSLIAIMLRARRLVPHRTFTLGCTAIQHMIFFWSSLMPNTTFFANRLYFRTGSSSSSSLSPSLPEVDSSPPDDVSSSLYSSSPEVDPDSCKSRDIFDQLVVGRLTIFGGEGLTTQIRILESVLWERDFTRSRAIQAANG